MQRSRLVGIGKTAHATHDTKNVIVDGVDTNLRRVALANRVVRERELERRIIDTGHVARA